MIVHLAGPTIDILHTPTALGLQGKTRRKTRQLRPGMGTGERFRWAYPAYTYDQAQPGFAELDMEEYNNIASDLAWTRSIKVLRKGFCRDVDIEKGLEENQEGKKIYF